MKTLEFKIDIAADRHKVWDTMLSPDTYKKWVKAGWGDSFYEGNWEKGENIRFVSSEGGGTLANLVEKQPYQYILAKHIAVINKDGSEDRTSDLAKGWVGITESYTFTENNGKTELKIVINTNPEWESMFNEGWPNALVKLKEICEN